MSDIENLLEALKEKKAIDENKVYPKPVLKELSAERTEEIHAKGMITPSEKKKEYDDIMRYCPFTNGCSRCYEFENCDDCLTDYVNTQEEWDSIIDFIECICKGETKDNQDKTKILVLE